MGEGGKEEPPLALSSAPPPPPALIQTGGDPLLVWPLKNSILGNRTQTTLGGVGGLQAAWRGPTPLPVWTFEITYCCYFFSLLTLGQRSPRPLLLASPLVALGTRTDIPTFPPGSLEPILPPVTHTPKAFGSWAAHPPPRCSFPSPPYLFTDVTESWRSWGLD